MILLYTLLLLLLVVAHFAVGRRVASLEKKFTKVARETDEVMREPRLVKAGNSNKPDPYAAAKQAYLLGRLVDKRERVEAKYVAWQRLADGFGAVVSAVRGWKGRKLPYAVGVLDVLLVLGLLDHLGYREQLSAQALVEFLSSLVNRA